MSGKTEEARSYHRFGCDSVGHNLALHRFFPLQGGLISAHGYDTRPVGLEYLMMVHGVSMIIGGIIVFSKILFSVERRRLIYNYSIKQDEVNTNCLIPSDPFLTARKILKDPCQIASFLSSKH
jgi:hypothetical protein